MSGKSPKVLPFRPQVIRVAHRVSPTSSPFNGHFVYRRFRLGLLSERLLTSPDSCFPVAVLPDLAQAGISLADLNSVRSIAAAITRDLDLGEKTVFHCHSPVVAIRVFLALRVLLRDLKTPIIWTLHNTASALPFFRRVANLVAFLLTSKTVFVGLYAFSESFLPKAYPAKCALAVNGVDVDFVQSVCQDTWKHPNRVRTGRDDVVRLISLAKGDDSQKQTILLIELLQACKTPFTLTILGASNDEIQSLAAADDRIQCLGVVSRHDALVNFSSSHILVSTSAWEGLPMGVIEALACGTPALLSDIGPHQEIAHHVRDCVILDALDSASLERGIATLFASYDEERLEVALRARLLQDVSAAFSVASMHRVLTAIYETV